MSSAKVLTEFPLSVRWSDMDAYGHVNNAVFASYVEEARLRWFESLDGPWRTVAFEPVIAAQTINYRRPLGWPALLRVSLILERRGNSSLTIGFTIAAHEDPAVLYADGSNVLVWIDPATGRSTALPEVITQAAATR